MSSFKRLGMVLALMLSLSACGFKPLYGSAVQTQNGAVFNSIAVDNIPDRNGQFLRNYLIDRLYTNGGDATPAYDLVVSKLSRSITSLGIKKNATSTRGQILITARMQLKDKATKTIVLDRMVRVSGDYNRIDNQYATIVSEQSATDGLTQELGDNMVTELALYFSRKAQGITEQAPTEDEVTMPIEPVPSWEKSVQ